MSFSPNSSKLLQRTIDLNYDNKKRATSLKWILINGVLCIMFSYDLCSASVMYMSVFHYIEVALVALLAANVVQHAFTLTPRRRDTVTLTPDQQRLLGLNDSDLDSSFHVSSSPSPKVQLASPPEELSPLSLPPRRAPSPHTPPPPATPPSPRSSPVLLDRFISDRAQLNDYLKEQECVVSSSLSECGLDSSGRWGAAGGSPQYVTSSPAAADSPAAEREGGPAPWPRLRLDPRALHTYNMNMRLWLHLTIFSRLVREMDAIDAALTTLGLTDIKIGEVSVERLQGVCAAAGGAGGGGALGALQALLPYLRPFPDQRHVVKRVRELASGGCLSAYRWGAGETAVPSDAELVLHAFATYVEGQAGAAAFQRHLDAPPAPGALAIKRVSAQPPLYALVLGTDTLQVPPGRNNLLHTLVLFVAGAARRSPPLLCRLQLGRAGLNLAWVIQPAT